MTHLAVAATELRRRGPDVKAEQISESGVVFQCANRNAIISSAVFYPTPIQSSGESPVRIGKRWWKSASSAASKGSGRCKSRRWYYSASH